ncbi:MAG: methyltransferase domain-containing protein [Chloroflexota bacterium]
MDKTEQTLEEVDTELGKRYGEYAGFTGDASPYLVETYGEDPENEVRRLLGKLVQPSSKLLDIGCGPGHTLSLFASQVKDAWGIDGDEALLEAAQLRAAEQNVSNVTFIHADTSDECALNQLPNAYFDIAYCESGPGINAALIEKLAENAIFVQEIGGTFGAYQFHEIMGRKPYTYYAYGQDYSDQVLLSEMAALDLVPISIKNFFYEWYFRDVEHLEANVVNGPWHLGDWRMGSPLPYDSERDRAALELYAAYNTTPKGVRFQQQIRVFVWRRDKVHFYPIAGR